MCLVFFFNFFKGGSNVTDVANYSVSREMVPRLLAVFSIIVTGTLKHQGTVCKYFFLLPSQEASVL